MSSPTTGSEACRYSIEELLCLRISLPLVKCVVDKLNKHVDIAGIVRIPEEALKNPETFSCKSNSLADITNKRNNRLLARKQHSELSEGEDQLGTAPNTIRHPQPIHWNLRRRDSSDSSSQPHSAPTSSVAQQSENFQRFYRAVVSPTHVRVTAGGRIVPNTRVTAPPAFEWNAEKHIFESKKSVPDSELNGHQTANWLHSTPAPPGFPPLFPAPFVPPYNFNQQGNSLSLAAMPSSQGNNFHGSDQNAAERVPTMKANSDATAAASQQPGGLPQPIKISPPAQFDQTKPFIYNGQLVYPVPPPNALPISITMLGNPNFVPPAPAGATSGFGPQPHFPIPLANLGNPLMFPPGQQPPMVIPHAIPTPENVPA